MPTTLTPPEIDRHRISDGNNGHRPPTDKRTGGNGDGEGDNWNESSGRRRSPHERLAQARIGLFFALGGDMMFFVALVSVFFVAKSTSHFDAYSHYINEWLPTAIPTILWLNTIVLLFSTITAEIARRAMFREADAMDEWIGLGRPITHRATLWLTFTLLLGTLFLAGQWVAWDQLTLQQIFFETNPSSHFFYLITIAHAVHLFLGIVGLIIALAALQFSRSLVRRQILVDTTVWYWHVMSALWIFLFLLLEYGQ